MMTSFSNTLIVKIYSEYIFTLMLTSTALTSRGLSIFFWMPYFSRILFRTFSLSISSLSCLSCLCLLYARLASSLKKYWISSKVALMVYIKPTSLRSLKTMNEYIVDYISKKERM